MDQNKQTVPHTDLSSDSDKHPSASEQELWSMGAIEVHGARVHNLKNIDVSLPRHKLTVVTGLSGSGKSSLAFDTLLAEGQRRYLDTFSSYARSFIGGGGGRPDVDEIVGLSPVVAIEQKSASTNPRSALPICRGYEGSRRSRSRCQR